MVLVLNLFQSFAALTDEQKQFGSWKLFLYLILLWVNPLNSLLRNKNRIIYGIFRDFIAQIFSNHKSQDN